MTVTLRTWIERLLIVVVMVASLYRAYSVGPSGAHMHRQTDTLGMTMALADRVRDHGVGEWLSVFAYPRVLQNGPYDGVVASEFQFLSFLTSPFFLVDTPRVGFTLSILLLLGIQLFAIRRFLRTASDTPAFRQLIYVYSSVGIGYYLFSFLPEALGFPLALLGIAFFREKNFLRSILAFSLAVLVKPVFVVAFFAILFERSESGWPRLTRRAWAYAVSGLACVSGAIWYGYYTGYILEHFTGPHVFNQAHLDPIANLKSLGFSLSARQFYEEIFFGAFPYGIGLLVLGFFVYARAYREVFLVLLSISALLVLDGIHITLHTYYYVPCGIFVLEGAIQAEKRFRELANPALMSGFALLFIWGALYLVRTEVWITHRAAGRYEIGEQVRASSQAGDLYLTDDGFNPWKLTMIGSSGWTLDIEYPVDTCAKLRESKAPTIHLVTGPDSRWIARIRECLSPVRRVETQTLNGKRETWTWIRFAAVQ